MRIGSTGSQLYKGFTVMSRFREPFSGFTHLAGAVFALGGLIWLIVESWGDAGLLTSMIIYGVSLIALYSASAALHLIKAPERVQDFLNRIDHAAIYLLIAGTYTPFCYALLSGGWRSGMLTIIWGMALAGIAFKLLIPSRRETTLLSTLLYIGMGWLAIIILPQLVQTVPLEAILLMGAGGITYTAGAVVYMFDNPAARPKFSFHDAWHLFVMAASAMHFSAVLLYLIPR